ncbi:hypothetical protein Acor_27360 [Acrocarpospora corrugata]|uniref:Xylose isomerase-like TIM barrel domain-containing protein n=1 Tax=Acrocarpospora corrugata TaxID=35763 RepID=A0A5M3VY73_9ACTN|nr:hypothetical protein [Acrocarpospora corrugata]GES00672.1 hypothetical protein Acor_27360 [Acrocarpospora corrugata]
MIGFPAIGLSSGTLPQATAAELADAVLAYGGSGVDLRIGKDQRWERDGVAEALSHFAANGLDVFYTGVGWRLGTPAPLPEAPPEWPVKVFCVETPDLQLVADQVAAASEAGLELWVETHAGGPAVRGLIDLAGRTGVGIVLDVLGLGEIGGADRHELADLAPHVRAAQVKGVLRTPAGVRHRPLSPPDLDPVLSVLAGSALRCVTVESRAGAPAADLAVLARALAPARAREKEENRS